jgi:hypothetical protein
VVLGWLADDAYASVLLAAPFHVEMVRAGGDVTYAGQEWIDQIAPGRACLNPESPTSGRSSEA